MSGQYIPRFLESLVTFEGNEDPSLICTNCGSMFPLQTSEDEQREHLSTCLEIKAPYIWNMTHSLRPTPEGDRGYVSDLFCNGRLITSYEEPLTTPDELNKWQCSPFELVTDEYRFKYDFDSVFLDELESAQNFIKDALNVIEAMKKDLDRATPYLDANLTKFYSDVLTTSEAGLRSASNALPLSR